MKREACDILKLLFRLELWRRKHKKSMEYISLELGLSNEVYREWMAGQKLPNHNSLNKIREFLGEENHENKS